MPTLLGERRYLQRRPLQPRALHHLVRLAAPPVGDLGVAGDRGQAPVTEGLGGEPSVADRLLQEGAQGMAQLVGVEGGDLQLASDLAADVPGAVGRQAIVRGSPGRPAGSSQRGRGRGPRGRPGSRALPREPAS